MFKTTENKKGIYVKKPSPLNLEYRKKVSFLKDDFSNKYLNKFKKDMEFRFNTKITDMTDEELILFAVKFLSDDKNYQYFYIYNNENVIGEIYTYSCFSKDDYYFSIYIDEDYRKQENYIDAILYFENRMYFPFGNAKNLRVYIDSNQKDLEGAILKSNFKLRTELANGQKEYICKEYMVEGMSLEVPTLEHEKKYKNYLKNSQNIGHKVFNYNKWLKDVEKNSKEKKEFFLMYYNDSIQDTEIVGVGHILNNWKKTDCIQFEIEKAREQTDFGKYFLEMLLEELDENAEYIRLTCQSNNIIKVRQYEEVLKEVLDNEYQRNGRTYFEATLIVY